MTGTFYPITIKAPGILGLNSEISSAGLDPRWATVANNIVFDFAGRITPRKGTNKLTTTAITGSPNILSVFEYLKDKSTSYIISAAGNKIYHGTTSLTNVTGTLSITDDDWKFQNFNGKVVGFQDAQLPVVWDGTGNFVTIQSTHTAWQATTAYVAGNAVKATAGHTGVYFLCTSSGTSAGSEPSWSDTENATVADGSTAWKTIIIPDGDEVLSAWGRLWAVDDDKTTIRYSALRNEKLWDTTNGGGTIDMLQVWIEGGDFISSLASFNNYLIIFGKHNIAVYSSPATPSSLAISDTLSGIGCLARDTIHDIGTDLLFLSGEGVRSFTRTIQTNTMPLQDISKNIHNDLVAYLTAANIATAKATYSHLDGIYILKLGTVFFCFDLKSIMNQQNTRVTQWDSLPVKSMYTARDGTLYFGCPGYVADYSGYDDNGSAYVVEYRSPWLDLDVLTQEANLVSTGGELLNRLKILKQIRFVLSEGQGYSLTANWSFDFSGTTRSSRAIAFTAGTGDEWSIGEWNDAEFSGSTTGFSTLHVQTSGFGQHVRWGFTVSVNGRRFGLQKVDLMMKLGRRIN